jgi:anti-sigma regulatory factor (Ser/Thr protein kinase)
MMRESWLPAKPESATRARTIVRQASIEQGLDDGGAWSLMLATTEAVSNAILHGRACSDGDNGILLRVLSWDDGLWVEVCDCGRFEAGPLPPAPDETHGRGIPLITAVVDHLELVPDGPFTRVRFGKRRRPPAAAPGNARRGEALLGPP